MVGFREVYRQPNNRATFVSNGNTYHDLGLTDVKSRYAKPGQRPGLWHLAFEVENEVDLVDGYNRALAAGVKFAFMDDHDVAHSLYFTDPDGLLVEVYADVMDDWRSHRKGIINKEKPKYVPGVTSKPVAERLYPKNPQIDRLENALFHPRKVTHVALVTPRFEESLEFYTRVIGLQLWRRARPRITPSCAGRWGRGISRSIAGARVWTPAFIMSASKPGTRPISSARCRADGEGIEAERIIDHPVRRAVTIRDPDGLRLQFFVNRQWTPQAAAAIDPATALYLF